jgi:SSS family solute:Na+ symporter
MPDFTITTTDIVILVGYVIGTRLFFGWYFAHKHRKDGSEGYFLAGRSLRWPVIGLSFYVSNMSGSSFVGMPGSGYADGIAVYNYEWIAVPILVFFAFFLLPLFLKARVSTAPEFLEVRYNRACRRLFSGFLLFANLFIDAAAALYAGATVFQVLFPEIPLWVTILVPSLLAGVYIAFGGLGAAVMNDTVQAVMIGAGGLAIAILSWQAIPSWAEVAAVTPPEDLRLFRPASDPVLPWPGVISGVLVVGLYFWCMNQFIIQRALGAASLEEGRRGALFAGLLKLPNLYLLILPGVMGRVLYPGLERPDLIFPTLAFDLLPVGFRGLMLAALAAAILSSLESILNSAATLFTLDFYQSWRPQASDDSLVRVGRIATIVFMVVAAAWAPQITRFPTLWQYLQSILSYITPPVVAVFLIGLFWKRANHQGAFATLAIGLPLGVAGWITVELMGVVSLQFLYASGVMLLLSAVICVGGSLAGPPPAPERIQHSVWAPRAANRFGAAGADTPWWSSDRWQAIILILLTGVAVAWWA